jgi:hypothetical protein
MGKRMRRRLIIRGDATYFGPIPRYTSLTPKEIRQIHTAHGQASFRRHLQDQDVSENEADKERAKAATMQ